MLDEYKLDIYKKLCNEYYVIGIDDNAFTGIRESLDDLGFMSNRKAHRVKLPMILVKNDFNKLPVFMVNLGEGYVVTCYYPYNSI